MFQFISGRKILNNYVTGFTKSNFAISRCLFSSQVANKYPDSVPILPVWKTPLLPGITAPITVSSEEALKHMRENPFVGVFLVKPGIYKFPKDLTSDDFFSMGTLGSVSKPYIPQHTFDKKYQVNVTLLTKIQMEEKLNLNDYPFTKYSIHSDKIGETEELELQALAKIAVSTLTELNPSNHIQHSVDMSDFANVAYSCAAWSTSAESKQEILETSDIGEKLRLTIKALQKELDLKKMETYIATKLDEKNNAALNTERLNYYKSKLGSVSKD